MSKLETVKHFRPGTSDEYIMRELKYYEGYEVYEDDLLLDLGAHIGIVSDYFLRKGIWRTVCVEANKDNFELLKKNMEPWYERAPICYNRGVTSSMYEHCLELHISKGNTGGHTTKPTRGRDIEYVKPIRIQDLLNEYKPTILKMDIEGSEHDVAKGFNVKNLESVRIMFCELHWFNEKYRQNCFGFLTKMRHLQFECLTDFEDFPNRPFRNAKMGVWLNRNLTDQTGKLLLKEIETDG